MAVQQAYDASLKQGLVADTAQAAAVAQLQALFEALTHGQQGKGAYLYGPVGRGKSHVMQYVFDAAVAENIPARRVHFHKFMEELHQRMHQLPTGTGKDPMRHIAEDIYVDAHLLCFDEFYITNIADAMLLGRLLEQLFKVGVTLCATSNWPMAELFQGGMNRDRFLPFIQLMEAHLVPLEVAGEQDYRTLKGLATPLWKVGEPSHFAGWIRQSLKHYGNARKGVILPDFPKAEQGVGSAAWYTCVGLCGDGVGREHYLELAEKLTTLIVSDIPYFPASQADMALRFITLVDVWYEAKKRLLCTSVYAPAELCVEGDAAAAFARCVSRIQEMQHW